MHSSAFDKYFLSCDMLLISNNCTYFPKGPELIAIIEGTLSFSSDTPPLRPGTVAYIAPAENIFQIHDHCVILRMILNPQSLLFDFPLMFDFPNENHILKNADNLFYSMINFAHSAWLGTLSGFRTPILYFYILENLENSIFDFPSSSLSVHVPESFSEKQSKFLMQIIRFADEHFMDDIGLSEAAAHFTMTPQYISSIFKTGTGMTFRNYLIDLRKKKAESFIKYTNLSYEEIAAAVHIKDHDFMKEMVSFNVLHTPGKISSADYSVLNAATALTYISDNHPDIYQSAELCNRHTVSVSHQMVVPLPPVWKQLINLGYAVNFDHSQTFHQLTKMQKNIGFCYGRICRLFDLVVSYRKGKHTLYDYNRIFRILDVLTENHMYPFIELGNKRLRIQLTLLDSLVPDVPQNSYEYFEYLLKVLPGFICACINRYGYQSIRSWKFEVSAPQYEAANENADFSTKIYMDYFTRIRNCIRKYVPECQVGGPGFNDWGSPELFKNLLVTLRSNNVELDFLTAYLYPLYKKDSLMKLSADPYLLENRMANLMQAIAGEWPQMQLWITEFNSNLSSRNFLNDSSYQAAFIAHTLFAAMHQKVSALGYYLMSDTPLRYADTLDMLFGGWGLFTDTSIPKPSYHTWYMFSKLGTYLTAKDGNCMITSSTATNYQCILYHYEHLTSDFCENNVDKTDFLSPDHLFIHTAADSWEIIFNDLPPGYYLIREYCTNPSTANLLFQWYNMHFLTPVKSEDYQLLHRLSDLQPSLSCVRVTENSPLFLHQTLSRQEIKLITLDFFHPLDNYSERKDDFNE